MTPDPATIREFVARTRPLCDAATEGQWWAEDNFIIGEEIRYDPEEGPSLQGPIKIGETDTAIDAAFVADARTSLPAALNYIDALMAERERDAPAIRAAVRLAAQQLRYETTLRALVPEAADILALAERMEAGG